MEKIIKDYNTKKKKFVNGMLIILDDAVEKLKEEGGYEEFHLRNGEIWLSKGCPRCSDDKIRLK